jgi:hypothetical protein
MMLIRWHSWRLFVCLALLCAGCGSSDETNPFEVSGTVTFNGQPVPAGVVLFTPDGAKGNHGATGFAKIKAGKFDTRDEGRGTVGGAHVVTINGFDGNPAPQAELPDGKPLFPDYTVHIDLPKETTTHDFNIPASAK